MELTRITKHKKPRYQHLRIGFRPSDSTWLVPETPLDWVNHSEAEHKAWSVRWAKLFSGVDLMVRGQVEPLVIWECFDCAYQMTTDAEEPMEECDRCGSKAIYVIGEVRDDD